MHGGRMSNRLATSWSVSIARCPGKHPAVFLKTRIVSLQEVSGMQKKEKKVNATADNRRMERHDQLTMKESPGKQHGTDHARYRAGRAYPLVFDNLWGTEH